MIPHDRRPWYEPYHRLFNALVDLSAHLIVLAAVLSGIKLFELFVHRFLRRLCVLRTLKTETCF